MVEDLSRLHQFGKKVLPGIFLGYDVLHAGVNLERRKFGCRYMRNWRKMDASEIHARKTQRKGSVNAQKMVKRLYSRSQMEQPQLIWRRSGSENIHLHPGWPRPKRRTIKSSKRIRQIFFNHHFKTHCRMMVKQEKISGPFAGNYIDRHHVWTESHTLRAERRILPNSTTVHWHDQSKKYDVGCDAWTPHRRLVEYRRKPRPIRFVDWIPTNHHIGRKKNSRWVYMVQGGSLTEKQTTSRPDYLWAIDMGRHARSSATKKKNNSGQSKNRSLTTLEDCAVFTSLIQQMRSSKEIFQKCA